MRWMTSGPKFNICKVRMTALSSQPKNLNFKNLDLKSKGRRSIQMSASLINKQAHADTTTNPEQRHAGRRIMHTLPVRNENCRMCLEIAVPARSWLT